MSPAVHIDTTTHRAPRLRPFDQRVADKSRARHAKGMPDRDGAATDVSLVGSILSGYVEIATVGLANPVLAVET